MSGALAADAPVTVARRDGLEIVQISSNRWNENGYLLAEPGGSCVVIDPGYGADLIARELRDRSLSIQAIVATHTHFDHIASVATLQRQFGRPPFLCHAEERKVLKGANVYTLILNEERIELPVPDRSLSDGESIGFAGDAIRVFHLPGHTPGGCLFQFKSLLFTGDLLIRRQGRLHRLPGFDRQALDASVAKIFSTFGDESAVFPGHGPATTLGGERARFFAGGEGTSP